MTEEELKKDIIANFKKRHGCVDCGAEDSYMLRNEVWREAFPNYVEVKKQRKLEDPKNHTCVCIPCVEKRLGRDLRITDFVEAPINRNIFLGYRIAKEENG